MDKTRTFIFMLSGLFAVAGALLYITHWAYAPWLFAVGAAGVTVGYMTAARDELDLRRRRLNRWNVFAGIAMIVASVFMFRGRMEWVAFLFIPALIQLYTSFVPTDKNKKK